MLRIVSLLSVFLCACAQYNATGYYLALALATPGASETAIESEPAPGSVFALDIAESAGATSVGEWGATDSYEIRLTAAPTADVFVSIAFDATQISLNGAATSPLVLQFSPVCPGAYCWSAAQTVTIAAEDDTTIEGAHATTLTHTTSGGGPGDVGPAPAAITIDIYDNDVKKKIFVSSNSFNGNMGGVAGVDARCMSDLNYPGSGTYRALIADGVNRIACTTANCSGGASENVNWVLQPYTIYIRASGGATLFQTNGAGIFVFGAMTNSFTGTAQTYYSGLNGDWTTATGLTCSQWTSTAGNFRYGVGNATNSQSIAMGSLACVDSFWRLYCVEQ